MFAKRLNRRGERGFTLLETVVALAILAVALTALFRAFSDGLRGVAAAEAYGVRAAQAQAKLETVGATIPLAPGDYRGRTADGARWHVRVRVWRGMPPRATGVVPLAVRVTVHGADGREVVLNTLRLGSPP